MKKYDNEILGLYFNNGVQGIATIRDEDEHFMYVEDLLGIQLTEELVEVDDGKGNRVKVPHPKVALEDFTPFAVIEDNGLKTRIPQSAIMLTFPVQEQLLAHYKRRVGKQIEIISAPSIINEVKRR